MLIIIRLYPVNIYLFKVSNRNTRKRSEICSKSTIKTPKRHQWHLLWWSYGRIGKESFHFPVRGKIISYPADIYLLKSSRRSRIVWEICLKLTIKTPEQSDMISLFLTYRRDFISSGHSIDSFEQVNAGWVKHFFSIREICEIQNMNNLFDPIPPFIRSSTNDAEMRSMILPHWVYSIFKKLYKWQSS